MERFDDFILGADDRCRISTDCHKTKLNNNILVVGGSGSGKTTSIVNPMLLHMQHANAVGIFTKKGMIDEMSEVLESKGYKVYHMDFVDPWKEGGYGFDPLHYCKNEDDIKALAQGFIREDPTRRNSERDAYWEAAAEIILIPILRYVWKGLYFGRNGTIDALELLDELEWTKTSQEHKDCQRELKYEYENNRPNVSVLCKVIEHMKEVDREGYVAWKSFLDLPDVTGGCVASELQSVIQQMFQPTIRNILRNPRSFDFRSLAKEKAVLFVRMSPVNMAQHRYIGLFYQHLFKCLFEYAEEQESGILPRPVHVICDDFATGTHIQDFANLISIFREKQISATMLLQSESQLEGIYGKSNATTIINNCDTYIYLGGMDIDTARNISVRINKPLEEVLNMPIGDEIFIRRGQKPIIIQRYDLWSDEEYLKLHRKSQRDAAKSTRLGIHG